MQDNIEKIMWDGVFLGEILKTSCMGDQQPRSLRFRLC